MGENLRPQQGAADGRPPGSGTEMTLSMQTTTRGVAELRK